MLWLSGWVIASLFVGWAVGSSDRWLTSYRQWQLAADLRASKGRTEEFDFSSLEKLVATGHRRQVVDTLLDFITGSDVALQSLALELLSYCEEDAIIALPILERLRKEAGTKDEIVFRATIVAIRDRIINKFPSEMDVTVLHGSHRIIRGTAVP